MTDLNVAFLPEDSNLSITSEAKQPWSTPVVTEIPIERTETGSISSESGLTGS